MELFESVQQCIDGAYEEFLDLGHTRDQIKTIGITTQRETTICWDSETGEPLYNAVVWPDTRTSSIVRELKARDGADKLQDICGLPISTYPSGVKLLWMLRNVPNIKKAYDENRLSFGTVDSWLIYKLNGGKEANVHVTDTTNASRTMFMNLKTLEYDDTILDFFQISRKNVTLPKIVPSADKEAFGKLASTQLEGMTITGCLGDQSAALVGQCGFTPGSAKSTYGTGCFVLYNVGTEPVFSTHGLLATVAYDFGGGRKPIYALEGSVAVAGSGVKFLMNNLGFIAHSSKITELAESVKDNGGVVFVTAFSGLFAPYWIDDAKGTLCKFGGYHGCAQRLIRVQLESRPTLDVDTLPAQLWKQHATKPKPSSMPWRRTRNTSSGHLLSTEACPILISRCKPKQTFSVSTSIDLSCERPQLWEQPLQQALPLTSGQSLKN